ncbi:MAG: ABC transporter permease subunit [Treponema sp.]|jgi:putative spermidine/putrescine transport system permease protein|nr:ABC transporter permease subunit [Treponema sp.]
MKAKNAFPRLVLSLAAVFLAAPFLVIVIYSFVTGWSGMTPSGFTLTYYDQVLNDVRFWPSVFRALLISIAPVFISGFVVLLALYSSILYFPFLDKYIQSICMLPHTVNGVILAISVLTLYAGSPTPFGNRMVMLTFIYCVIILPFVYQGIRNNLHAVNIRQLIEAAEILGAGKLYAFLVIVVPNIVSGILVAALLGISRIFTDYVVIKIIAGSRYLTPQQLLYNFRDKPGQFISVIILITFFFILLVAGAAYYLQNRNVKKAAVQTMEE